MMQTMTKDEQKIIETRFQESKRTLFILCFSFVVGLVIISYILFFHFALNENNWYLKLIPGLILALDISVLYFVIYPKYKNFKADKELNQKEVIQTQITNVEERHYKNSVNYFWILKNEQKLSVDVSQFQSHKIGDKLIFHIAPNSKILLAVEKQDQFL